MWYICGEVAKKPLKHPIDTHICILPPKSVQKVAILGYIWPKYTTFDGHSQNILTKPPLEAKHFAVTPLKRCFDDEITQITHLSVEFAPSCPYLQ